MTEGLSNTVTGAIEHRIVNSHIVDVTDVAEVKVKFSITSNSGGTVRGRTTTNRTYMTFIKLSDS